MAPARSFEFGPFRLDADEKILFHGERPVALTPKATETLVALVERHGRLVTKEELLRIVWPDAFVEENNLAQNVSLLRRVLSEGHGDAPLIETVPKRGYRFVGTVVETREGQDEAAPAATAPSPAVTSDAPNDATLDGPPASTAAARPWTGQAILWGAGVALLILATVALVSRPWSPPTSAPATASPANASGTTSAGGDAVTRIAVFPFVNLGSPADESFVAGITEEVTSRLASLNRLAVPSSTTLRAYDRRGKTMPQIGADLGVAYVVEGSIRWAPQAEGVPRIRITPQLIRVADDTTVWTHQYDTALLDLFGVQADIAYQVTGALQVALDAPERRAVEARPTADTDAYMAYLRGIAAYRQGSSDTANMAQARAALEEAVARDPRFALAWSWLAQAYASLYTSGAQRTPEVRAAAYRAAQTANDLDVGLPEAHLALAVVRFSDRDYEGVRRELDIARVGLPNSADLWQLAAWVDQRQGRWRDAEAEWMRAFAVDPAWAADRIGEHYLHLRQYPEARRFLDIARAADRSGAVVPDAWTRFSEHGDVAAARPVLESALEARVPADGRVRGLLARLEWFDGRHQRALDLIAAMDPAGAWLAPNFRFPASVAAGQVYESMGKHDAAARSYAAALAELEHRQRSMPDDYKIEAALALTMSGLGRSTEAVRHAKRAVELMPEPGEGFLYLYFLAQVQTRAGQHAAALATLDEMFNVPGFYNEHWVQRDPGFAALRTHPSFRASIERWSSQRGEALLERKLVPTSSPP